MDPLCIFFFFFLKIFQTFVVSFYFCHILINLCLD